jgi:hypothetical protein
LINKKKIFFMDKKIIFSIIAIIIILVVVFLSQQAYLRGAGKSLISDTTSQIEAYAAKGSGLLLSDISGEVAKKGSAISSEVNQEKQKVSENILGGAENYVSGIENSIVHPGTPQNCPALQSTAN